MKILLLISLIAPQVSYAQNPAMELKTNINNKKTRAHINMAGTKLLIVPPADFEFNNGVLENKSGTSGIFAIQLPGPFNADTVLSKYKAKGITPQVTPIKIGKYKGIYCRINNFGDSQKSVDFGDEDTWINIIASSPNNDAETEAAIVQSLNSIYIDEHIKPSANDLADLIFSPKVAEETDWAYFANNVDCKLAADTVEIRNGIFPQLYVTIQYKGKKNFPIAWSQNFGCVLWQSHFVLVASSAENQKSTENLKSLTSNIYPTDDNFSLFNDVSILSILDFNTQPGQFVKGIFPKKGNVSLQLFVKDKKRRNIPISQPFKMSVL